jgi:iron(III) transport system substrate-binding protein
VRRDLGVLVLCAIVLAACDRDPPAPVVVYVPTEFEERANDWLPESGLLVTVIAGDSAVITDRVISKQDSPRADVLFTSGIFDIWRAADEGAMRPLEASVFESVPVELRDPDHAWAATSHRSLLIGMTPDAPDVEVTRYADLGSPEFAGQLCLTSSSLPANRALIGMLIEDLGLKPAERIVRSWSRNLAQAPFATESELVAALESGACSTAIISASVDVESLARIYPDPTYRDIHGIGVTRHAGNPEAGARLVEWVLSNVPDVEPVNSNGKNIGIAGWRREEARLLAERAGYR